MAREELALHWRSLAGSTIAASVGAMGLYLYTEGSFVPAMIAAAGYTKEQLSLCTLLVAGATAICAPIAGLAMDRFGPLRIVAISIAGEIAALLLLGLSPPKFPIYATCLTLLAALGIGTAPPSFSRIVVALFDRMRGLALGTTVSGLGVMAIGLPILTTWLIGQVGWRSSYFVLAGLVLVFGGIGALLIRSDATHVVEPHERPRRVPSDEPTTNGTGAVRRPLFWITLTAFFLPALFGNGYLLHLIVLLRERGFSPSQAAGVQAMVGIAMLLGRLSSGAALDRFPARLVTACTFAISAFGCALLLQSAPLSVSIAAFAIGVTIGAELDLMAYFISRYFGVAHFGRLYGLAYSGILIAVGMSPLLISYFEGLGGYTLSLTVSAIGILGGATVVLFMPKPRRPQTEAHLRVQVSP